MKRYTITKLVVMLLAVGTMAFTVDDKKETSKKAAAPKTVTTKTKKKAVCCESGIPARFAAAGAKVLKKDKPATAAHK